jgi:hypothetical protein
MNLHIIHGLGIGGAENVFMQIARKHVNCKNVKVICLIGCSEDKKNVDDLICLGFQVKKIFNLKYSEYSLTFRLINALSFVIAPLIASFIIVTTTKISKVYTHMPLATYVGVCIKLIKRIFGSKILLVETFHTNWYLLKYYYKFLFYAIHRFCDIILVEMGIEEYRNFRIRYPKLTIYFLPFYSLYLNNDNVFLKPVSNPIKILAPMRITFHEKPIEIILNGFLQSKLANNNDYQLNFVGGGKDFEKLKLLVKESNCLNIELLGSDPELSKSYVKYDLCLAALGNNELGIAAIESFNSGIGVVGIGLGEISDDITLETIKSISEMTNLYNNLLRPDMISDVFSKSVIFFNEKVSKGVDQSKYDELYN